MTTKTFTLSGTFPEESIIDFAKNEWRNERVYNDDWEIVENTVTPIEYVSNFFLSLITSRISSLQKMKVQEELNNKMREAEKQIDESVKSNLSITIE